MNGDPVAAVVFRASREKSKRSMKSRMDYGERLKYRGGRVSVYRS
jgi:hypothetical protein